MEHSDDSDYEDYVWKKTEDVILIVNEVDDDDLNLDKLLK